MSSWNFAFEASTPNTYEVTGSDREVVSSREAVPTKSGRISPFTAG